MKEHYEVQIGVKHCTIWVIEGVMDGDSDECETGDLTCTK